MLNEKLEEITSYMKVWGFPRNSEDAMFLLDEISRLRQKEKWIPVSEMPKKKFKDGEFGKEYLIHPRQDGEVTAFFGTRWSTMPHFYKHGTVFHNITHYREIPAPPSPDTEGGK